MLSEGRIIHILTFNAVRWLSPNEIYAPPPTLNVTFETSALKRFFSLPPLFLAFLLSLSPCCVGRVYVSVSRQTLETPSPKTRISEQ